MKKSVYDISIGGLAIILPKSDKVNIVKGKMFPLLILEIPGKKMKLKAECVNTVTIDRYKLDDLPYGGYKIAFRFAEMSAEDRALMTEYVTHQMLLSLHHKKAN
jgi:c-di-GMP-binding flagellar brake protein YcgR